MITWREAPVRLSAWASKGPGRLCHTEQLSEHRPERTVLLLSYNGWVNNLEETRKNKPLNIVKFWKKNYLRMKQSNIQISTWPFKMHSFSQSGSWRGGGVMKMTLSADTPDAPRICVISFRLSGYSSRGMCCCGFLSTGQEHTVLGTSVRITGEETWHKHKHGVGF